MVNELLIFVEFVAAALGEDVYLNSDKLMQAFNMFDKVITNIILHIG